MDAVGDEFEFRIVASDRDLGDKKPFENIQRGRWKQVGKAQVLYLSPKEKRLFAWRRLLRAVPYDLVYLNSCFSTLTVMTLLLRRLGLIPDRPVLLAVRGEFSRGALSLKWLKKKIYLLLSRVFGFYDGIFWHASSRFELEELKAKFKIPEKMAFVSMVPVRMASELVPFSGPSDEKMPGPGKERGSARIVFLARIARIKNLDVALELVGSTSGAIDFDIYGPLEDAIYWKECQRLLARLPDNVRASYKGIVPPDRVADVFSQYHLFLFPTQNENFGHVILEALCAGCPVMTSTGTAWRGLEAKKAGWDIPLSNLDRYRQALAQVIDMDAAEFKEMSRSARLHGHTFVNNPAILEANRNMFLAALSGTR